MEGGRGEGAVRRGRKRSQLLKLFSVVAIIFVIVSLN